MSLGIVYAGQGSQKVGMGQDFYEKFVSVRKFYDHHPDIRDVSFTDEKGLLNQTMYTQPAMVAFAIAVTDLLQDAGVKPSVTAGLSLGEFSALYSAGVFDAETVMSLIRYRGKIMQESTTDMACSMVAVLGLELDLVKKAVESVKGIVDITNVNCPGQVVIGGEKAAVTAASAIAKELGAKKCIPLNVSGPFHTRMMSDAGELLKKQLDGIKIHDMQMPVVFNVSGDFDGDVKDNLVRQIKSPVQFEQTIRTMQANGVDTIIEVGPGKVLSGFIKKTAPEIKTLAIETAIDFNEVVSKAISSEL